MVADRLYIFLTAERMALKSMIIGCVGKEVNPINTCTLQFACEQRLESCVPCGLLNIGNKGAAQPSHSPRDSHSHIGSPQKQYCATQCWEVVAYSESFTLHWLCDFL